MYNYNQGAKWECNVFSLKASAPFLGHKGIVTLPGGVSGEIMLQYESNYWAVIQVRYCSELNYLVYNFLTFYSAHYYATSRTLTTLHSPHHATPHHTPLLSHVLFPGTAPKEKKHQPPGTARTNNLITHSLTHLLTYLLINNQINHEKR